MVFIFSSFSPIMDCGVIIGTQLAICLLLREKLLSDIWTQDQVSDVVFKNSPMSIGEKYYSYRVTRNSEGKKTDTQMNRLYLE